MQSDRVAVARHASAPLLLLISVMAAAGFALTVWIFYPGIMTYDARYIYADMLAGKYGDWQSPLMIVLWRLVDPIAPGSASMFLLIAALYWLAFAVLALALAPYTAFLALAAPVLALLPPASVFSGIIWRDVIFASAWLLASALAFAAADRAVPVRLLAQAIALCLVGVGVLLRPNAILAAPILIIYVLWPAQFHWRRAVIVYLPAAIACYALVQVVYYGVLGATRQNPLHPIMVFDLGGITHFAKENQFPVEWSPAETALLTSTCYDPSAWDSYWTIQPCSFVMRRLEGEQKIFGTPALPAAWAHAILRHPLAYPQHRVTFMWRFLAGDNLTMWTKDLDDPTKTVFADRPAFNALRQINDALKLTPLFRVGAWLLLNAVLCGLAWRRRDDAVGAFTLGVCGSAAGYVLTFFAVGVATDFRYALWSVFAGIAGALALATRREAAPGITRPVAGAA